ncbi:MAG: acetylxylan esterase, partial [Negativicutes bacterium]|nr:acetylxylan esterase [Negativicutes bacterium]
MPEALPGFCLATHQTVNNEKTIDAMLKAAAAGLPKISAIPASSSDLPAWQAEIRGRIQDILGPFPEKSALRTRLFNQVWENGMLAERITFQSEEGISIPGLFIMPEEWKRPVPFVIYAGEWGKNQGIQSGLIEEMVQAGYGVLAVDVRGVGETATTDFEAATNLLMMDRPLFGQRVLDVIRAVDFIWERCYIAPQIDKGRLVVAGSGVGGLWALYAAALDRRVAAAVVEEAPYSYTCLLEHGARFPASVYLFDVLKHFDLAHVMASCAPRPVYLRPVDGWRRACSAGEVEQALQAAKGAFSLAGARPDCLRVVSTENEQSISSWLDAVLNH